MEYVLPISIVVFCGVVGHYLSGISRDLSHIKAELELLRREVRAKGQ